MTYLATVTGASGSARASSSIPTGTPSPWRARSPPRTTSRRRARHPGAGIGWWREEFEGLGVPYEERAARTDEALRLMRVIWTTPRVRFDGRFWQIAEAGGGRPASGPAAADPHLDRRPRRRGPPPRGGSRGRLASARVRPPVRLQPRSSAAASSGSTELAGRRDGTRAHRDRLQGPGRVPGGARPDRVPLTGSPAQIIEDLPAYVPAGVRHFVLNFGVPTPPEMLDVLARFAADVRPRVGAG